MKYTEQIKPVSYVKTHTAKVLQRLNELREPIVITQNGVAKAVMQDIASYEQSQEALALLKILAVGNRQIEAGQVMSVSAAIKRLRQSNARR